MSDVRVNINKIGLQKELVLIEYPGLVKNEDNMLKTLGGPLKISQAFSGYKRRLELRFHPDNVFNKPAFGDITPCCGLLLKVKIRTPKKSENNEKSISSHTVEILGRCKTVARFETPCDNQFLPILKNPVTNEMEYIYDKIVPKDVTDIEWFNKADQPLFPIPPLFCKTDAMGINIFQRDSKDNTNPNILGVIKHRHFDNSCLVTFTTNEDIPKEPSPDSVRRMTIKLVSDKQLEKIKSLFNEHPIWTKSVILYETKISKDKLKTILPFVSYYYLTGPWRTMYVRYGYDPRKDFNSRHYQNFDFRVRNVPLLNQYVKCRRKVLREARRRAAEDPSTSSTEAPIQNVEYPYFEEGCVPGCRQKIYRYCDIHIPQIQEMLERVPGPLSGVTCNEKSGWLPQGFDEQCRTILLQSVTKHLKNINKMKIEEPDEEFDEDEYEDDEDADEYDIDEIDDYSRLEESMEVDDSSL